jgi:aspartyl aminopeptidase
MQTEKETPALFVSMDNEETGSNSYAGADGNFLKSVLKRITRTYENYAQCMSRSIMISADNAHSVHPSHTEKHDDTNSPVINGGPVIKYNASGKYATTSRTAAHIRHLAACGNIPLQNFVSRTDMPCGSTIGPIISAALGIETIDLGVPMLAMHSLRETAGSEDAFLLLKLLEQFYNSNVIS